MTAQQISTHKQLIEREKQLTKYAKDLVERKNSIKIKKKKFRIKYEKQLQNIAQEYEENINVLQRVKEQGNGIKQAEKELYSQTDNLTRQIVTTTQKIANTLQQEKKIEEALHEDELNYYEDMNEKMKTKILAAKDKISQIGRDIMEFNSSIVHSNMKLATLKMEAQTYNSKIQNSQAKIEMAHDDFNNYYRNLQNKHQQQFDQIMNCKKDEMKLYDLKNMLEIKCSNIQQKIGVIDNFTEELESTSKKYQNRIKTMKHVIHGKNEEKEKYTEEKKQILQKIDEKNNERQKNVYQLSNLTKEIEKVTQETNLIKSSITENVEEIKAANETIENTEAPVEEYSKCLDKMESADLISIQLQNELKSVLEKEFPKIETFPEIINEKKEKQISIQILDNDITQEKETTEEIREMLHASQEKVELLNNEKNIILGKLKQAQQYDDSILLKLNEPPTVENVTNLVNQFSSKREQRLQRKKRDNETLQKRYKDMIQRIDLRKRKMKRQAESLEQQMTDIGIVPDEERLGIHNIGSFIKCIQEDNEVWMKFDGNNSDVLLHKWEKRMDCLYDELDEFFMR
ncbi:hypothetical protein TRFO_16820 [Tritrichomonas foetus]|uniref:Uncharacterized protein n=1 Tax=Tritrichomonas foetus TaxID=1144522 RepID=A0A1J4KPI9_9EUKA|nr:hypothetical protein TRFO_16820 [Tritrichomonas foetus]|eukprot:OHT13155.1 hypothetical protein TRFO_16820 [Tritrichomonas foetus]